MLLVTQNLDHNKETKPLWREHKGKEPLKAQRLPSPGPRAGSPLLGAGRRRVLPERVPGTVCSASGVARRRFTARPLNCADLGDLPVCVCAVILLFFF